MKQLNYTVNLLSPVLITSTVGDENISMSEDYLTGTSLLGMFANLYVRQEKSGEQAHQDPRFKSWFLSRDLRFLNGYKINEEAQRALPTPLSIQFPKSADDATKAPPQELLFEESDDEELKHRAGYCILQNGNFESIGVETRINFHHRRTNPVVGRSKEGEGEIFNYQSINPAQTFGAAILGEEQVLKNFQAWFEKTDLSVRLGRSKNTQYGRAEIRFSPKIEEVNELHDNHAVALAKEAPEFALTFLSHVIPSNDFGHAAVEVSWLTRVLLNALEAEGLNMTGLKLIKRFVRSIDVENYVSIWKARKPAVSGFKMGSCFLFGFNPSLDDEKLAKMQATLSRLQQEGIGARRNEGFGRIAINWQQPGNIKNVTADKREQRTKELKKPGSNPPPIVAPILRKTFQAHYAEKARGLACAKLETFEDLPPGSQIGRLQRIAELAETEADFRSRVSQLKEISKSSLRQCRTKDKAETLLEFLETSHLTSEGGELHSLVSKSLSKDEVDLCREISYNHPEVDSALLRMLFKEYMSTFLGLMRKQAKD
jgi:CRISPR-associated protein Csx10